MIAVGLLVVLYGTVGFPDVEELTTNPEAALNFDMSAAAADTYHPAYPHNHPHGCQYTCTHSWQQGQNVPNNPTNNNGVNEPTNTNEGSDNNGCGVNRNSDGWGGCTAPLYGRPSRCTGNTSYDPGSRLCISNNPGIDPDSGRRACRLATMWHNGDRCVVKTRDDDPERSRHCPAGQVFNSTIGCAFPCPSGSILVNGTCRAVSRPQRPQSTLFAQAPNIPQQCPVGYSGTPPNCVEGTPEVYVLDATVDEIDGTVDVIVALSHRATTASTVDFATADDTATAGDDYTAVDRTVTIPANTQTATVSVAIIDDTTHEPNVERFTVTLSNVSGGATMGATTGAVIITDDDPVPPLVLDIEGTPSVVEGGQMRFMVRPDQAPATEATVRFRVKDAFYRGHPLYVEEGYWCGQPPTADYARISNDTLTFSVGQTWGESFSIQTCDDIIDEQDKTITVELFDETAARIGTRTATGTLRDNDAPSPYPTVTDPTFFIDDVTVTEGDDLVFTVTFMPVGGALWGGTVYVDLTSPDVTFAANGAACSAGVDAHIDRGFSNTTTYSRYQSRWQGGATTSVRVKTCADMTQEDVETITATLRSTQSGRWGQNHGDADVGSPGTGTIIDDDAPQVTLEGPVSAVEGSPLDFKLKLDSPSISDVVVTVSTGDDPAATHPASAMVPGLDYQPTAGRTVTIPAGAVEAAVPIATVHDLVDEYDEMMLLRIDDVNSTFPVEIGAVGSAVGTITDDDTEPVITVFNSAAIEGDIMSFTLTLSHPSQKGVTVDAATAATGSAAAVSTCGAADGSEDYEIGSATVAFADLATVSVFNVTVCDDTAVEGNETFLVAVSPAVHASVSTLVAAATIIDNDVVALCSGTCPPPVIQNQELLTNTAGGDLRLRISMDFTLPGVVPTRTFTVTATGGTAVAGTHFELAATTLTFDAATPTHEITIPTYVRYDHGTSPRTFTITIQDTDPNRSHITVTTTGTLNPPAIGRQ